MSVKRCSSCGATVEVPENIMSTQCGFCESPLVDVEASPEPVDLAAPFEVPRDRAGRLLGGFLQGHWLAPEALRKAAKPEELNPVLVPFYCYDAVARTEFSCRVGIYWYRTETYTTTVNGKVVTRTRQVRETEWHSFQGSHARKWYDHLVSASKGLPEVEANELEPFDLGKALPFSPAMAAGYQAEIPTVEHDEAHQVAANELAKREQQVIAAGHLPGDTYSNLQSQSQVSIDEIRLVLLPVWTAVYQGPKGAVRLLVNGQTGEVVGSVPRSGTKVGCLAAVGVTLLLMVVGFLLFFGSIAAIIGGMR